MTGLELKGEEAVRRLGRSPGLKLVHLSEVEVCSFFLTSVNPSGLDSCIDLVKNALVKPFAKEVESHLHTGQPAFADFGSFSIKVPMRLFPQACESFEI
jgi:hypothetical protein